ncbi:CBS domain-containing protein [Streptomyces sp. TRM43335]|uniref:CBS domain-containing protein n=1 Tax=Streptomyces taklimakanensis TaxID=2569853 RepID=A0A6G2BHZ5_9ACTN|nr:CBS domain-containing protein [Streptomyces taklimakanensis]MTE21870.1 CBS domain-containing protein [Streptomyces taklimakanensis]
MAQQVNEIMTADPTTVTPQTPIVEVARLMKEEDIGEVLVAEEDRLRGLVTDRDLVVRAMAEARDVEATAAQDVCSADLVTCSPNDDVSEAVRLMREHALRRLPVLDGEELVGVVSIGDLAVDRDPSSALSDISATEPNR